MRRPRSFDRKRGGFTIIEVLLAMGVLLLGMTAVLGLLTFGAALSRTAQLRTSSAALAEAVVADLEETLFPVQDGALLEPKPIKERALGGLEDIVYSATARQNPRNALEYRVDVDMTWKSAGIQREKRFTTLLLREIPFGERLRKRLVERESAAITAPATTKTTAPPNTPDSTAPPKK